MGDFDTDFFKSFASTFVLWERDFPDLKGVTCCKKIYDRNKFYMIGTTGLYHKTYCGCDLWISVISYPGKPFQLSLFFCG